MKGHVPTPDAVVALMVEKLFAKRLPEPTDVVIDPGCGDGPFIQGILSFCMERKVKPPHIIGVESDPKHLHKAQERFRNESAVSLIQQDYLTKSIESADFIIGNPPYVAITGLDNAEKKRYRHRFITAVERFDLYILFFEQSLRNLKPGGRLCFITPEKFTYVNTATSLRRLFGRVRIEELHYLDEETFGDLVTYPIVTTLENRTPGPDEMTRIQFREKGERMFSLPKDGKSWSGTLNGFPSKEHKGQKLNDICIRVSCGVATGADNVYIHSEANLSEDLHRYAYPTISGRQLNDDKSSNVPSTNDVMLIPYDKQGRLLREYRLGSLRDFLLQSGRAEILRNRACVGKRKRTWYRFHDSVPLADILRPKILCKDVTSKPHFWADRKGRIVPRHSVYYITPKEGVDFNALLEYLNSAEAKAWMMAHCQRAANGYYRLQSTVLKRLPIPPNISARVQDSTGREQLLSQSNSILSYATA